MSVNIRQQILTPSRWARHLHMVLIVGVVNVLMAPPAYSEPTISMSGEDLEAAQLHFDWGIHHVRHENWREGLAEFDASIAAVPNRSALFNRALCLRNLNLYSESVRAFEEYLAFLGNDVDEDLRAEARAHIEAMQQGSGQVVVGVNVPNASILIDQHEVGQSPLDGPILLPSGRYQVSVARQGYETSVRPINVVNGQDTTHDVTLIQARGSLRIVTNTPGAVVWIDGGEAGTARQQFLLEPGPHDVVVRADRRESFEQRVDIEPGGQQWLEVTLEPRSRRRTPRRVFWTLTGLAALNIAASFILLGPSEQAYNNEVDPVYHGISADSTYSLVWVPGVSITAVVGGALGLTALVLSFFTNWQRERRAQRGLRGVYQSVLSDSQVQTPAFTHELQM